ncbi:arginine--tRNA ligase [Prochlorothrix hollandica]|uniref:arginine--tRNA ligase n=1 Tax=Prochlorothrix hollandica TaxID=1223 RepID=UPI003341C804
MTAAIDRLTQAFNHALHHAFGLSWTNAEPLVVAAKNPDHGDYQCNAALGLAKTLKQAPRAIASQLLDHLPPDLGDLCDPPTLAGPGFINLRLHSRYLATELQQRYGDDRLGIAPIPQPQRIVVDFSSPNIAKEMHVGHLRSTIIGDSIARILEFLGHEVLRLNHVGDWGTQFGMLITYLREVHPDALTQADALDLGDLVAFYKKAKQRFDGDPQFQAQARDAVVRLQQGEEDSRQAWQLLCNQSRREFQILYDRLNINLTERGESFYNPFLEAVVTDLKARGLLEEDEGAQCVFLEGFSNREGKPQPLIIQKSNGGYNYATTDLAAVRYRITQDHAQRLIYITDAGQSNHFAQFFQVAQRAGWVPDTVELAHVPFGLVQGEDGKKLKTRSGDTIRLRDLLDEAWLRADSDLYGVVQAQDWTDVASAVFGIDDWETAAAALPGEQPLGDKVHLLQTSLTEALQRQVPGWLQDPATVPPVAQPTLEHLRQTLDQRWSQSHDRQARDFQTILQDSQTIGHSAVKYADLSQNRTSNYVFSYDKMLSLQGNTAPYMLYAYVRVQGISRKGGVDFQHWQDTGATVRLILEEDLELALAKHLLQLETVVQAVAQDLLPNRLCQYLFELSQKFNQFYDRCPILKAEEPQRTSRLLLADLTARTLKLGLSLLGISVLERM